MNETPFYRKPVFWVGLWVVVLVGIYLYQIITQLTWLGIVAVVWNAGLLIGLFSFWMAFYAQFILPVRNLDDRSKIIHRLKRHISKSHGPALFIQNGRVTAKEGELERKQAGVIWVDSASAAVTRTVTAYKRVLGPGVHFTDDGEYLAGWLDLHTQVQNLGPLEGDLPFQKLVEAADDEARTKYKEAQKRRMAVSALTRDGIEVVPNIAVVFKIDAQPAADAEPGSRFGYDENAVFNALSREGVNPAANADSRRVAWNQIPALIAADLWREYAGKFTLNQLFEPSQPALPEIPQPEPIIPFKVPPPLPPARVGQFTRMLRVINREIEKRLAEIESKCEKEIKSSPAPAQAAPAFPVEKDARPKTALQTIAQMIKARMTQTLVPILDESGRLMEGHAVSEEYRKLQERGLKIISVSISNPRLPPALEERAIKEWNANWLVNAKAERNRIERKTAFVIEDGKRKALLDYTLDLSRSLIKENPSDADSLLLTLLERSRNEIIRDDRLRNRITAETARSKEPPPPSDLTPALMALLDRSRKEVPRDSRAQGRASADLEVLDQIIKRAETHDL